MDASQGEKTEKITVNLGLVDLGQIDLLVQEGFYTNRTDFIRTAIRTQLATRGEALDQTVARRTLTLGSCHYARRDLEEIRGTGQMISTSGCWGWRASPPMSLPSSPWLRSPQWRCSAPSVPQPR